jgi:hypothetical protein
MIPQEMLSVTLVKLVGCLPTPPKPQVTKRGHNPEQSAAFFANY